MKTSAETSVTDGHDVPPVFDRLHIFGKWRTPDQSATLSRNEIGRFCLQRKNSDTPFSVFVSWTKKLFTLRFCAGQQFHFLDYPQKHSAFDMLKNKRNPGSASFLDWPEEIVVVTLECLYRLYVSNHTVPRHETLALVRLAEMLKWPDNEANWNTVGKRMKILVDTFEADYRKLGGSMVPRYIREGSVTRSLESLSNFCLATGRTPTKNEWLPGREQHEREI